MAAALPAAFPLGLGQAQAGELVFLAANLVLWACEQQEVGKVYVDAGLEKFPEKAEKGLCSHNSGESQTARMRGPVTGSGETGSVG